MDRVGYAPRMGSAPGRQKGGSEPRIGPTYLTISSGFHTENLVVFPAAFVIFRLAANPDGGVPMPITIKLQVAMSVEESGLEDALAEYDELTVEQLVSQILDKQIALEGIEVRVLEGPNSLEDYDKVREANG